MANANVKYRLTLKQEKHNRLLDIMQSAKELDKAIRRRKRREQLRRWWNGVVSWFKWPVLEANSSDNSTIV